MSTPVRLESEAEAELIAAHARYEAAMAGLGEEFADAVGAVLTRIAEHPTAFPLARGVTKMLGVRAAVLGRFPFTVVFVDLETEIRVLALAHQRRRPLYWRRRGHRQKRLH